MLMLFSIICRIEAERGTGVLTNPQYVIIGYLSPVSALFYQSCLPAASLRFEAMREGAAGRLRILIINQSSLAIDGVAVIAVRLAVVNRMDEKSNGGCSTGGCNRMDAYDWASKYADFRSRCGNATSLRSALTKAHARTFFVTQLFSRLKRRDLVSVEGVSGFDVGGN